MWPVSIITLAIVVTLNAIFSIIVLFQAKRHAVHISFALWTLFISVWAYANAHFQVTPNETTAYGIALLSYTSAVLLLSSFLFFSYIFPNEGLTKTPIGKHFRKIVVIPTACILLLVAIPGGVLQAVNIQHTPRLLITSAGLYIYSLYIFVFIALILRNLCKNYLQNTGIPRMQLKYILVGAVISIFFGMTFNLVLPLFNNYTYTWLGPDFTIIMVVLSAYAILRYRLFDMQIRVQKILNMGIPLLVSLIVATFLALFFVRHTSVNSTYVGFFIFIVAIFIYESLRYLFLNTTVGYVLFQNTYRYQRALRELSEEAPTIIDLDVLTEKIFTVLVEEMHVEKVAILISNHAQVQSFDVLRHHKFSEDELQTFSSLSSVTLEAFDDKELSYLYEEIEYELLKDISASRRHRLHAIEQLLQRSNAHMILSLYVRQRLMGFILLGAKEKNTIYSLEDINLLEEVSKELAIALVNSKLHTEETQKTELLQKEVDHATEAWKQKSHENEELSMLRSQFISVMSHQLRTPISVIRNSLELVLEDYLSVAQKEDTHISKEQMKHIVGLLNNAFLASDNLKNTTESILASSEFIGVVPGLQINRIETEDFFQQRVRRAQRLLEAKSEQGIQFKVDIQESLPEKFVSDERKLALIIDNLLSNAALYTIRGHISFGVYFAEGYFTIQVSDTGIGIPKQEQNKVFQRFIRLENAQRVVPDGSGLGLFLAKSYIELLRGTIDFVSEEGHGTTFTIKIPVEYRYIATE